MNRIRRFFRWVWSSTQYLWRQTWFRFFILLIMAALFACHTFNISLWRWDFLASFIGGYIVGMVSVIILGNIKNQNYKILFCFLIIPIGGTFVRAIFKLDKLHPGSQDIYLSGIIVGVTCYFIFTKWLAKPAASSPPKKRKKKPTN